MNSVRIYSNKKFADTIIIDDRLLSDVNRIIHLFDVIAGR